MPKRHCLTLELKDDPALISEYKRYHQKIWPDIEESIKAAGIADMEIYLLGTRLFMVMEVDEHFSFEAKAKADRNNPKVREWEQLMSKFQKPLPQAKPGDKKSTRLNSSHVRISYAVFCLKKKKHLIADTLH